MNLIKKEDECEFQIVYDIIERAIMCKYAEYMIKKSLPENIKNCISIFYDLEPEDMCDIKYLKIADRILIITSDFEVDNKHCFDLINFIGEPTLVIYHKMLYCDDTKELYYQIKYLAKAIISIISKSINDRYCIFNNSPCEFEYSMAPEIIAIKYIINTKGNYIDYNELGISLLFKDINLLDIIKEYSIYELLYDHKICIIE